MQILKYPHPLLRQICKDITRIDQELIDRVAEMFETMYESNGIGLAAPQVGWNGRLFIVNATGQKEDELVFINPRFIEKDGVMITHEEGCLSLPGLFGKVKRSSRVRIQAYDLAGEKFELEAEDLLAIALQHEYDHLDGNLFITRLSRAGKLAARGKVRDFEDRFAREHPEQQPAKCPV